MIWSRWSGAGNTFYIADEWHQPWKTKESERPAFVQKICGAFPLARTDGLLYLEKKDGFDFSWNFYNSDGSSAEMCGNAARCVAEYYFIEIENKKKLRFLSKAGEIQTTRIRPDWIEVLMPEVSDINTDAAGNFFVNTGVPHYVLEGEPDIIKAKSLRHLPDAAGSNVTFISNVSKDGGDAVTYERGVEGFTLACGTGAVAAGAYLAARYGNCEFKIQMPGGELLIRNAGPRQRPFLEGPAKKTYDLEYFEETGVGL